MAAPQIMPGSSTATTATTTNDKTPANAAPVAAKTNPLTTMGGTLVSQAASGYAPAQVTLAGGSLAESEAAGIVAATNNQGKGGGGGAGGGGGGPNYQSEIDKLNAELADLVNNNAKAQAQANADARAQAMSLLQSFGFNNTNGLNQLMSIINTDIGKNETIDQISLDITSSDPFNKKFPAIQYRIQHGLPPITVTDYINTLDSYTQTLVSAGIDPGKVDLNKLVEVDVSPTELTNRIQQGYLAVALAPQDVISAMQNYYGVTAGQLVQHFTDPALSEGQLLQQAAAAQIGGAATGSGFMGKNAQSSSPAISGALALQLAQQGVTYSQAQSGFGQLANESQLYNRLPGQGNVRGNGGAPYTPSQLAEAQFFGGPAEQQLQLQAQQEQAYFKQGTNVGTSGSTTGLGALQR